MRKKFAVLLLLAAVIFAAGCVAEETAEKGDTVAAYYTLSLDDGTVYESNVGKAPLSFTVGAGQMISGFDAAVEGMKVGETKKVRLSPAEAYGEITDDMLQTMPVSYFIENIGRIPDYTNVESARRVAEAKVSSGDVLQVTINTGSGYQRAYLKVLDADFETVTYALVGSALAGEYLTFEITLDSIA